MRLQRFTNMVAALALSTLALGVTACGDDDDDDDKPDAQPPVADGAPPDAGAADAAPSAQLR
jgi:hypothetical protein